MRMSLADMSRRLEEQSSSGGLIDLSKVIGIFFFISRKIIFLSAGVH